jgi:hypothetical protein
MLIRGIPLDDNQNSVQTCRGYLMYVECYFADDEEFFMHFEPVKTKAILVFDMPGTS